MVTPDAPGSLRTATLGELGQMEEPAHTRKVDVADIVQRTALPAVWVLVAIIFAILLPTSFLSQSNVSTIFGSQTVLVMATLGLIIPMTAGDFDLSISGTIGLSNMVLAITDAQLHWPVAVAILLSLLCGLTVGAINGGIVTVLKIDSLIATLGTGTMLLGVVLWISSSQTISGISPALVNAVVGTTFLGVPLQFYYGVALCIGLWLVLEYTTVGRRLLFVGRGRAVSRLSGLHVTRLRWGAFMASGTIAGLAGVIWGGTTGAADPSSATEFLLPAFAAAFLGATSILPGRFNPWGSLVAVYFLVTGTTGFQLLGAATYVQQLFYGGALVVAVALAQVARRGRESTDAVTE
jgi:ribose transport system permease protein